MADCVHEDLLNFADFGYDSKCALVKDVCDFQAVPFTNFYYCSVNESIPVLVILTIVATFVVFHFLGSTSENYLSPALSVIAEKFRFSEALAGVTLVALANGAPDVISAFSSGGSEGDDSYYTALGSIFGANLFTTTIVLGRCIAGANNIQADWRSTSRDLIFFIVTTLYLLILGWIGRISIYTASGFFVIYFAFLVIVVYHEYQTKVRDLQKRLLDEEQEERTRGKSNIVTADFGTKKSMDEGLIQDHYSVSSDEGVTNFDGSVNAGTRKDPQSFLYRFKWVYKKASHQLKLKFVRQPWGNRTIIEKILSVYEFPLDVIRDFSIPCADDERWNRRIAPVTPYFATLVIVWQFGLIEKMNEHWWVWILLVLLDTVLAFLVWKVSHRDQIPRHFRLIFCAVAFLVAALWINYMANVFQDLLVLLTVVTGLPNTYLGLTLLAWGNSTADFFVDYALAKQGLGLMAVSGVFAGQLFNLLVGFGASLVRATAEKGTLDFKLYDKSPINTLNLIIISFVLALFVFQLVYLIVRKFHLTKMYGNFLSGYYLLFFIIVTAYIFI